MNVDLTLPWVNFRRALFRLNPSSKPMVAFSSKYLLRNIFCSIALERRRKKSLTRKTENLWWQKKASRALKHPLPNLFPPFRKWRRRPKMLHNSFRTSDQRKSPSLRPPFLFMILRSRARKRNLGTRQSINQSDNSPLCWLIRQSWITHCACSYVTREALALGREWTVRGWIRLRSKFFFAKLVQLHYVYFDSVQARTCWHKEDKCLNWNSRLVEEVEVDCTRSLVCGAMWKFLVYRRIKTTSTCRKTVNKLIWEQIWLNLQDRRFDIWEKKTEFNGEKMKLVFLSCLA